MKYKTFLAAALIVILAATSCGTKRHSVAEQLVGVWAGVDTIQIVSYDTLGNINIETIAVPVAIEYFADTTMSGKVKYNDTTMANITAVVMVGDPYVSYSGVMNINNAQQDINGELFYQENPESLTMEFFSKDPATGAEHRGKGMLKKQ